jgi:hypothetical protein
VLIVWPTAREESLSGMIILACQTAHALLTELGNYSVEGTGCVLRLHIGIGAGIIGGTSSFIVLYDKSSLLSTIQRFSGVMRENQRNVNHFVICRNVFLLKSLKPPECRHKE